MYVYIMLYMWKNKTIDFLLAFVRRSLERQDEDKIVELEYEKNHAEMEKKAWRRGKWKPRRLSVSVLHRWQMP